MKAFAVTSALFVSAGLPAPAAAACHGDGCRAPTATPASLAVGVSSVAVTVAGQRRRYRVYRPARRRATPWPVVVMFHGGGESGERMAAATRFDEQAERRGFIAVYPDALGGRFNAGACCNPKAKDVALFDRVLSDLRRRVAVDRTRVFAGGFSNGGFMAYRLACQRARVVAGIAVVAALEVTKSCTPARPVSVLHVHARNDPKLPFARGRFGSPGVRALAERWRRRNACAASGSVSRTNGTEVRRFRRCRAARVVEYRLLGAGGHTWPGADPPYGPQPPVALDASRVIADFLARQGARPERAPRR